VKETVLVTLIAKFTFPDGVHRVTTVEEPMALKEILNAPTLADAVKHFLANTDAVSDAAEVTSFRVDGREIIATFIEPPKPQGLSRARPSIKSCRSA
jgi:hypothetical protein